MHLAGELSAAFIEELILKYGCILIDKDEGK